MAPAPREILAIITSRIGDTLMCTPALRAIKAKWPDSRLTVLAHPKRMEVLGHLPCIDRLQAFSSARRWLARLLPGKDYDLAFAFSNDRAVLAFARARARRVYAFSSGEGSRLQGIDWVDFPAAPMHAVPARLALVNAAGAATDDFRLAYVVTPEEGAWAADWLARHFPAAAAPRVALQLCSFPTKSHRDWPVESFARLIERVRESHPAAAFLITGDTLSAPAARRLRERFGECVVSAAGALSLRQTAALLSRMDLYVGVDTGPTHLAGALGIPMVALYHGAYPGRYLAPLQNERCAVIEHPATGIDGGREANMGEISVATVWAAAQSLLPQGKR